MDFKKYLIAATLVPLVLLQGCDFETQDFDDVSTIADEASSSFLPVEGRFKLAKDQLQEAKSPLAGAAACAARDQLLAAQVELDAASAGLQDAASRNYVDAMYYYKSYSRAASVDIARIELEAAKGNKAAWDSQKAGINNQLEAAKRHLDAMQERSKAAKDRAAEAQSESEIASAHDALAGFDKQCLAEQQAAMEEQVVADGKQPTPNDDDGINNEVVGALAAVTAIAIVSNDSNKTVAANVEGGGDGDGDETTPPTTTATTGTTTTTATGTTTTTTTTTTATSTTTATATATSTTTGT